MPILNSSRKPKHKYYSSFTHRIGKKYSVVRDDTGTEVSRIIVEERGRSFVRIDGKLRPIYRSDEHIRVAAMDGE